ncbi:hypothetical protein AJ80_06164 [Polytolypa hystricis UAMH7299]|uniref:1-phosphatidylinositol-3-phosphate 5-kinase n=1 Tax=Polytolypa hystricis (strain UAMH7299) TaxID=1447883 RepID=A0A2B7XY74_POLH7|nr:hypothetical protein AJ80_06164 [Polytolypa hystricis UAMH7299]
MASQRSQGTSSPSASSIFLPLGRRSRRGSRASISTQAERENLNEALDQIHNAACQSEELTVFNEFTNPPVASSAADNKGIVSDLQGGLTGLYTRFRASVGGVKDMVGGSTRVSETTPAATPTVRSPATSVFPASLSGQASTASTEALPPISNSTHTSKPQSPVLGVFPPLQESRLSSKAGSVSSKASGPPSSALKSPVAPLTKASNFAIADPAVTEVNVSAIKESLNHSRSHSGSIASGILHGTDAAGLERRDSALHMAMNGQLPHESGVGRQPHSPVLLARTNNDTHRDGRSHVDGRPSVTPEPPPYNKLSLGGDRNGLTELDTSFPSSGWREGQVDGACDTNASRRNSQNGNPPQTYSMDHSQTPSSVTNSISKFSTADNSTHDGRTATTLATSLTMTDKEPASAHSSKASIQNQRPKLTPRVSQSRLPGYAPSRKQSSDSAGSQPRIVPPHITFSSQSLDRDRPGRRYLYRPREEMPQFKNKLLSREFWMRDENAKDCFHCGEPFSTFRRKHHCRTCGQIFDSKCTSLIPGADFGHSGSVRVCRPCEAMINAHDDDSSDESGDDMSPVVINARTFDLLANGSSSRPRPDDDDTSSVMSQPLDHVLKTPTMAIPATRRTGDGNNRRSAILEINSDRPLTRPTSSRSLKSSFNSRAHSLSHKRHHSRHQYIRGYKPYHEDRAPFQRRIADDMAGESRLPAFHRDNIIDPDLAQYLSDDASSGDEQSNLFAVVSDTALAKNSGEGEKASFGGLLAAVKKGRSRFGDRSGGMGFNSTRDADDGSVSSSRAVNFPRSNRRRNLSTASSIHQILSPRPSKDGPSVPHFFHDPSSLPTLSDASGPGGFKMTRSSSMRGAGAPAIELNRASLEHVRKLLRQLLKDTSIPHANSWETALVPILLKATDDVDPAVQHGDDMDIRHYVKLKKIPGGRPGDTSYVSGLVFTKNLALKSMPRSIPRPNILIITFALEYARQQQHFMSLEPVIRQEREFLENLVSRIAALRPNLLLVEKNVSGLALELLEKHNIATAYNLKPSVIEAVSRCTQTRIITSMDRLATTSAHPGQCGSFDVKTYVYSGRKKTYMYISGCPKELGCSIVLRGADSDTLVKIKRITEFMVYVVYNLKLETCLMRDEFAKIPSLSTDSVPSPEQQSTSPSIITEDTSMEPSKKGSIDDGFGNTPAVDGVNHDNAADKEPNSLGDMTDGQHNDPLGASLANVSARPFYEDMVEKHQTKLLSASPFVKFMPPYLLMRARELERRLAYLKRLRDQDFSCEQQPDEKTKSQKFVLITPEMIHESPSGASAKVKEVLHAVHDAEYDRALHNYETQKRQWETYLSGNSNLFDPYAHQNIVVLFSLVCTTTSVPCSGPDVFALGFYNEHETDRIFEADCTLGQYVEELCHSANAICTVNGCEERMCDHHRQYVHGEAQVCVFVQPYPSKLRGLQDTILMWSCCKICGNETPAIPMSESTWKYSFGKYLELSFWSADMHARAGVCPHDLHRDHLRYFGFKDFALRIHYDRINLLEVIVPRPRVTWKVDKDLKLRNDLYQKSEFRLNRFMTSVKTRLNCISVESVIPEMAEAFKEEIEKLTKRANEDHLALIKLHQERYINSRYWEIVPLNSVIRATQEKVVEWDATFAEFESDFFPSEKDIKRLATLQLKKIFLDRDVSVASLTPSEEAVTTPTETDETGEGAAKPEAKKVARRMTLSAQEAKSVLASVVEEHSGKMGKVDEVPEKQQPPSPTLVLKEEEDQSQLQKAEMSSEEDVRHLDLASFAERLSPPKAEIGTESSQAALLSRSATPTLDEAKIDEATLHSPATMLAKPDDRQPSGDGGEHVSESAQLVQTPRPSGIPRPESTFRRSQKAKSPPLLRAQSQPAHLQGERPIGSPLPTLKADTGGPRHHETRTGQQEPKPKSEKRLSERLGLTSLKASKLTSGHSLIPRSVQGKRSRVSNLAKHFEQLSREFEKERQRERQLRASKGKQSRAYPMASSKPIVQVYKTVRDAVEERDPAEEDFLLSNLPSATTSKESTTLADEIVKDLESESKELEHPRTSPKADRRESEEIVPSVGSRASSEIGGDDEHSDAELEELQTVDSAEDALKETPEEIPLDLKELPKHEQNSLVKMLTNFWAERSASGWASLDYPLSDSDHVFADSDIIVREDEPSSLIAFALDSEDYRLKLFSIQELDREAENESVAPENERNSQTDVEKALLSATGTHLKYQFQEGQAKMLCKIFYAEQFDALRRKCGVSERIVDSLSRCMKWDSRGGKTKSLFLKTLDDRFILKSLSPVETQAFLKFAPAYFQIMSEALFHELPSAIAKMFGFYQVIIKNPVTGMEFNWFLLLMENLFYDRNPTRIFDLKGSMRNRKVEITGERNEVLLDENMVEFIYESPLFTREHSKKLLSQSVWNDTLFLARQNVMDYSLMIAIDENRQELVVGIIDCIRTYTWDKKLESWIKDRGFAGGGKNRPTVTSPKEYKSRFREAMARYVLHAPR